MEAAAKTSAIRADIDELWGARPRPDSPLWRPISSRHRTEWVIQVTKRPATPDLYQHP